MDPGLIGALAAAVVLIVTKLVEAGISAFRANREGRMAERKQQAELKVVEDKQADSEVDRAVAMYRELITDLKGDVKALMGSLSTLEKEHIDCREENARLRAELKALTEENARLRAELKSLSDRVRELESGR